MKGYWENTLYRFAKGAFPDGRVIDMSLCTHVPDEYDFIFVREERNLEGYYAHLSEGGIIAGEFKTDFFGDDITKVGDAWIHVKGKKGSFPYIPYVITIKNPGHVRDEMIKWGIPYRPFDGIRHKHGHIGCGMSYVELFKQHPGQDIMVFEDDVKFMRDPHTFNIEGLPADWDAVYMGAHLRAYTGHAHARFSRMYSSWTTHAVLYSAKFAAHIASEYNPIKGVPIDEWMSRIMPHTRQYVTNPYYATQRPGASMIEGRDRDYGLYIFSSQKFLA